MGKPKKYEERLMDAFAFDEDDLEANQAGAFSRQQIARLNRDRRAQALGGMFILLAGIIALALGFGAVDFAFLTPALVVILVGMSALFLGLPAAIWLRAAKATADLRENRVAEAEGRVDLSVRAVQNAASYYLRIGDMRFGVKQAAFLAMKNGDPYRIYYARRSKRILSVEWLRENDDNLLPVTDFVTSGESDDVEADAKIGKLDLRR